jgi:hypothetical protein
MNETASVEFFTDMRYFPKVLAVIREEDVVATGLRETLPELYMISGPREKKITLPTETPLVDVEGFPYPLSILTQPDGRAVRAHALKQQKPNTDQVRSVTAKADMSVRDVRIASHEPDLNTAVDLEFMSRVRLLQVIGQALQGREPTMKILAASGIKLALFTGSLICIVAVRVYEVDFDAQPVLQG